MARNKPTEHTLNLRRKRRLQREQEERVRNSTAASEVDAELETQDMANENSEIRPMTEEEMDRLVKLVDEHEQEMAAIRNRQVADADVSANANEASEEAEEIVEPNTITTAWSFDEPVDKDAEIALNRFADSENANNEGNTDTMFENATKNLEEQMNGENVDVNNSQESAEPANNTGIDALVKRFDGMEDKISGIIDSISNLGAGYQSQIDTINEELKNIKNSVVAGNTPNSDDLQKLQMDMIALTRSVDVANKGVESLLDEKEILKQQVVDLQTIRDDFADYKAKSDKDIENMQKQILADGLKYTGYDNRIANLEDENADLKKKAKRHRIVHWVERAAFGGLLLANLFVGRPVFGKNADEAKNNDDVQKTEVAAGMETVAGTSGQKDESKSKNAADKGANDVKDNTLRPDKWYFVPHWHKVHRGEPLNEVVYNGYGRRWTDGILGVAYFNHIDNIDLIYEGQELFLPSIEDINKWKAQGLLDTIKIPEKRQQEQKTLFEKESQETKKVVIKQEEAKHVENENGKIGFTVKAPLTVTDTDGKVYETVNDITGTVDNTVKLREVKRTEQQQVQVQQPVQEQQSNVGGKPSGYVRPVKPVTVLPSKNYTRVTHSKDGLVKNDDGYRASATPVNGWRNVSSIILDNVRNG